MKKTLVVTLSVILLGIAVLSGCSGGVSKEDYAKLQSDLADAQGRIAALERRVVAFSAYHMWYDQFYGFDNYSFADADTFNTEFGGVVEFIADGDLSTAWENYLTTEKPLRDYIAGLPEDKATWTTEQTAQFNDLATAVYNTLGAAGRALLSAIWNM
ncbi:MAG: hypothetical protein V1894_03570 [Chloroflexota bacterium]